jgi:hypothetical protein
MSCGPDNSASRVPPPTLLASLEYLQVRVGASGKLTKALTIMGAGLAIDPSIRQAPAPPLCAGGT